MSKLGSTFISEDPDTRGQTGPAGTNGTNGTNGTDGIDGVDGTGVVDTIVAGANVTVDSSDPANPVVASTATSSPTTTKGDLIKRGASADERLPVGSALDVLRVNAAGDDLEFTAPAAGGLSQVHSHIPTAFESPAYSTSAFAAKGFSVTCNTNVTVLSVLAWTNNDVAATYNMVICEVSGSSDTIDVILGTSNTSGPLSSTNRGVHNLVFATPIALVATKFYAFMLVRNDGTDTAVNRSSSNPTATDGTELSYRSFCRIASNSLSVSDTIRLDTVNASTFEINYTID